jgi:ParB family chromosome partitioning protein
MRLEHLPIALVYPNPNQPRKLFDQGELEQLGASIEEHGLLEPIKVRADDAGRFMIVCGERRYRAHLLIAATEILATVDEMSDDDLADRAIVENLQRANITPLEEARAFQARLERGYTVEQLAKRLGLRQPWRITERTNLLKLTADHQGALALGLLTPSQAQEMSRLAPASQRVLFEAIRGGRAVSYAELRRTVAELAARDAQIDLFGAEVAPAASDEDRAAVTALERKIGKVVEILASGFSDNEAVIARKVNPLNADVLAEQLELMEKQLKTLRLALRAAATVAKVA